MREMILVAALCALPTAALAGPPPIGGEMIATSAIVCDTKDQVLDLFTASKQDDGKGILPVYQKYSRTIDKKGQPTCAIQPVVGPTVKSVGNLGKSHDPIGNTINGWVVEISTQDGHSDWALYGELVKIAPPGLDI